MSAGKKKSKTVSKKKAVQKKTSPTAKEKRKGISKKIRFEIFERDGHTCQYCGGKPPEVTLEIDHKYPHACGGTNDNDNLVTSCFDCNRGKSDTNIEVIAQKQAASLIGVTSRRLRQMGQEETPPPQNSNGQYPAIEYGEWMKNRIIKDFGIDGELTPIQEAARLNRLRGDKIDFDLELAKGVTGPIPMLSIALSKVAELINSNLGALPLRLKKRCPKLSARDIEEIRRVIAKLQNEISKIKLK